jgi:hypothetical protein
MVLKFSSIFVCWVLLLAAPIMYGADPPSANGDDPEGFRVEITGSAWLVDSSGTIQAGTALLASTAINLVSDLGVHQQEPTFYGRFIAKPGRKHRIVLEGTPIRLQGTNTVMRTVIYRGQTFTLGQTLQSSADVNYFFAGYQYDVISRPAGHLGFSVGGAYLNATGTIVGVQSGLAATKSETVGLPLAGVEARAYLIPRRKLLEIDGGVRGMAFGSYGHYIEGTVNGGIALGPLTFQAGYRAETADLHSTSDGGNGVNVRLHGPIFSVQVKH